MRGWRAGLEIGVAKAPGLCIVTFG